MPIEVTCDSCGKMLRARDSAAGKWAKCPGCGDPIEIPLPQTADEEVDPYGFDDDSYEDGGYDDELEDDGWGLCWIGSGIGWYPLVPSVFRNH